MSQWSPEYIVVPELVDGCQMSCALCWNRNRHGSMQNMSIETINKIIEKHGHVLGCWYNWGEPLLHQQFIEISKLINKTAMSFISTNLSLHLSDEQLTALLNYTRVYISISGITKDIYDIYNKGGNFDLVFSNLNKIIQIRKNNLSNCIIILRFEQHLFNRHQYESTIEFCKANDILFEPIQLTCEVEDLLENFDHELLRKPIFSNSVEVCGLLQQFPIDVDGSYLVCCATHNIKTKFTVYDDVAMSDVLEARMSSSVCKECHKRGLFKSYY